MAGALSDASNCAPAVWRPLIVTAELGAQDLAWLDRLRRAHYPADRNQLPAHLTIFHALPPSGEAELRTRLGQLAVDRRPHAMIDGLMDLGGGVAFRIVSPDLDRMRQQLAADLHGLLGAQDSGGWRPHVTIQNKVEPKIARALKTALAREFTRRPLTISGLSLHRYLGGPWERVAIYKFR